MFRKYLEKRRERLKLAKEIKGLRYNLTINTNMIDTANACLDDPYTLAKTMADLLSKRAIIERKLKKSRSLLALID